MNTAWNRWCRNLPSGTALSLYDNRITPIIITDITGRRNVRIQNPYTCTTSSILKIKSGNDQAVEHNFERLRMEPAGTHMEGKSMRRVTSLGHAQILIRTFCMLTMDMVLQSMV